jgi:hypothetical protein
VREGAEGAEAKLEFVGDVAEVGDINLGFQMFVNRGAGDELLKTNDRFEDDLSSDEGKEEGESAMEGLGEISFEGKVENK